MKNLKKVLAFVMAFAMMLSVAVSAGALYPDVDDNASYGEATATLKALGIMEGDDKGNFNPDATIIRAEAAKVITCMRALDPTGKCTFEDVADDHWATGYIFAAQQKGIINGYNDKQFGPSDPVTYEQIIKMIVAALGRNPEAEDEGGYPSGYLSIASREGITKGVSVAPSEAAPRSAVARMVFNALEVNTMEQISYKNNEKEWAVSSKTLLKDYLKVDKYEGVITASYITEGDAEGDTVTLKTAKWNGYAPGDDNFNGERNPELVVGDTNAVDFIGQTVAAYVAEDDNTGKDTILGIAAKSGKNKLVVIDYTKIDSINGAYTELEYTEDGASRSTTLDIASTAVYIYNNAKDTATDAKDYIDSVVASNAASTRAAAGKVELLDNNNDDEYDYVFVTEYGTDYVVSEINEKAQMLLDKDGNNITAIDVEDEDVITLFYKDGAQVAFKDIAVGDVVTVCENGNVVTVYISSNKVEGTVSGKTTATDAAYKIGDASYRLGDSVSVLVGDEGIFYLNVDNRIVAKDATSASGAYAYLYTAGQTGSLSGKVVEMKFLTSEGAWETMELAKTVQVYKDGVALSDTEPTDGFTGIFGGAVDAQTGEFASVTQQVFQYRTNSSGKINKLYIIGSDRNTENFSMDYDYTANARTFSASQNKIGSIYMNDETKVFSVSSTNVTDEDEITLTKASALFQDGNDYAVAAFDVEGNTPSIVLAIGAEATIVESTKALLVTDVAEVRTEDGDTRTKIYGYQNGEAVEALIAEDGAKLCDPTNEFAVVADTLYDPTIGDVVLFSLDAENAINNVAVLFTTAAAKTLIDNNDVMASVDNIGEYTDLFFGYAKAKKSGGILEFGSIVADGSLTGSIATDFPSMAEDGTTFTGDGDVLGLKMNGNGVSFYEANLTRTNVTYTNKFSYSDLDATQAYDKVGYYVFVRVYDDVVSDVVAYRITTPEKPQA